MVKCRVHIHSENVFMDHNVYVELFFPIAPRVGDWLSIGSEAYEELERKAISKVEVAQHYYPDWFYFGSNEEGRATEANLKHLSFDDAGRVCAVHLIAGEDYVNIEINTNILIEE